eukprot:scaffold28935_cov101-Isochrysis_galbana.AAC.2
MACGARPPLNACSAASAQSPSSCSPPTPVPRLPCSLTPIHQGDRLHPVDLREELTHALLLHRRVHLNQDLAEQTAQLALRRQHVGRAQPVLPIHNHARRGNLAARLTGRLCRDGRRHCLDHADRARPAAHARARLGSGDKLGAGGTEGALLVPHGGAGPQGGGRRRVQPLVPVVVQQPAKDGVRRVRLQTGKDRVSLKVQVGCTGRPPGQRIAPSLWGWVGCAALSPGSRPAEPTRPRPHPAPQPAASAPRSWHWYRSSGRGTAAPARPRPSTPGAQPAARRRASIPWRPRPWRSATRRRLLAGHAPLGAPRASPPRPSPARDAPCLAALCTSASQTPRAGCRSAWIRVPEAKRSAAASRSSSVSPDPEQAQARDSHWRPLVPVEALMGGALSRAAPIPAAPQTPLTSPRGVIIIY